MDNFLNMNGYGFYIWTAYGFAALLLGGLVVHTMIKGKRK